jgi:hypothetical protein
VAHSFLHECATILAIGLFLAALFIWAPTVHQVFMG